MCQLVHFEKALASSLLGGLNPSQKHSYTQLGSPKDWKVYFSSTWYPLVNVYITMENHHV